MLGGRNSSHGLEVQSGTLDLGSDSIDPSLQEASYTFASGTRIASPGKISVKYGNTLASNVTNEGTLEILGQVVGRLTNRGTARLFGLVAGDVSNEKYLMVDMVGWNGARSAIEGNFRQTAPGILAVELCPPGWDCMSRLWVQGRADIAGEVQLLALHDAFAGQTHLPGPGTHLLLRRPRCIRHVRQVDLTRLC